ncbi:hypothetical protein DXG03_007965 [Asterophora parasitica]|uniref:Cleavage stimulation factor subunit 2 hinge domain-containing protein n=1 Tax=Asterophora parasitica TaxID=117018 RepID=A0A9P7KAJ1_9AGAR|nr:hypothetical protein DXG03_007965 [Asterophora parasitica]
MHLQNIIDHETAASAVRNLNNTDVGGRPLRIDLADSDPFLEGKTTVRGELIDGGVPGPSEPRSQWRVGNQGDARSQDPNLILAGLPPGVPVANGATSLDYISNTLATMQPSQLMEVLAQMKAFVFTHPDQAKTLLVAHPQLAYALFQALVMNKIVDSAILERMQAATSGAAAPSTGPSQSARPPILPPQQSQQYPSNPHPGYQQPLMQNMPPPQMSAPPAAAMFAHQQHHQQHPPSHPAAMQPTSMPGYYRPPPTAPQGAAMPQAQPPPVAPLDDATRVSVAG